MPRKLNYSEPKVIELMESLTEMGYQFSRVKDSIEVNLIDVKADKKRIIHLLSTINTTHKVPPLIQQVIENSNIMSIFDQRV